MGAITKKMTRASKIIKRRQGKQIVNSKTGRRLTKKRMNLNDLSFAKSSSLGCKRSTPVAVVLKEVVRRMKLRLRTCTKSCTSGGVKTIKLLMMMLFAHLH